MSQILQIAQEQIKKGREKAFVSLYDEALDILRPAQDLIRQCKQKSCDQNLKKELDHFENQIQAEIEIVEQLYSVVYKGQIPQPKITPVQQKIPAQQYQAQAPINNSNNNNNHINDQQMQVEYSNNSQVSNKGGYGQQQNPQQKKPQQPVLPYGKVPFAHHVIEDNSPYEHIQLYQNNGQQQRQSQQKQMQPQFDEYQQQQQAQQQQRNMKALYSNQQPDKQNIFQEENNFLRPNLYSQQQKDPDVWDDPAPKTAFKKKNSVKPTAGGNNKNNAEEPSRNYKKPWAVNTKQTPQLKKGQNSKNQKQQQPQEGEKESFLYNRYPNGDGPDKNLIEMLEREIIDKNPKVSFDDIADLETAKDILQEAVLLPIKMPKFFTGIKRPWRGVLLFGPPGTGKTMLAKAVATTGKTTFFHVSASSFASKWRGESEKLVRILFEMARFYAPTTIFFDEMDALGAKRDGEQNEASRRVITELLIQMDGCGTSQDDDDEEKKTVMVLAATNIPWDLDGALLRRLEKRILIPLPSEEGRKTMFELKLRGVTLDDSIDWDYLVKQTDGFSGDDIAGICREAAFFPMRRLLKKQGGFKNIDNMDKLQEEAEVPLTMDDFKESLKNCNKSVSKTDLKRFDDWMAEYGSV